MQCTEDDGDEDRLESQYAARWTPRTARPDGSALAAKLSSQAMAAGVLHAIDGPSGTHLTAGSLGKCTANMARYR